MYSLTINGIDNMKTNQRIHLEITQNQSTFKIKETRADGSIFTGSKPVQDAGRVLTLNSISGVAKYPLAIGLIQWEAEIKDQEGNIVKKLALDGAGQAGADRLEAVIHVWGSIIGCEWI